MVFVTNSWFCVVELVTKIPDPPPSGVLAYTTLYPDNAVGFTVVFFILILVSKGTVEEFELNILLPKTSKSPPNCGLVSSTTLNKSPTPVANCVYVVPL